MEKITDTELGVGGSHRIDIGFFFSMLVSLKYVLGKWKITFFCEKLFLFSTYIYIYREG